MLREVYWEGKAPTVKRDPDRLMSADEVSQTKQWEQARVLAEQLRELRGTPASKADQLAAMMGDPMGLPTPEVESSP